MVLHSPSEVAAPEEVLLARLHLCRSQRLPLLLDGCASVLCLAALVCRAALPDTANKHIKGGLWLEGCMFMDVHLRILTRV